MKNKYMNNPKKPLINKGFIDTSLLPFTCKHCETDTGNYDLVCNMCEQNNVVDEVTLEDEEELTYQKRVEDYESAKRAELDYNSQ